MHGKLNPLLGGKLPSVDAMLGALESTRDAGDTVARARPGWARRCAVTPTPGQCAGQDRRRQRDAAERRRRQGGPAGQDGRRQDPLRHSPVAGLPAPDATPLIEFNDKVGGISRDVAKAAGTVHKTLSQGMGNKALRYVHGKLNPLLGGKLPSVESLLGSVKALEDGATKAGEISDKVGKSLRRYQDTRAAC